jgi:hypothetical protein
MARKRSLPMRDRRPYARARKGTVRRYCLTCHRPVYYDDPAGPLCPWCGETPRVVWEQHWGHHGGHVLVPAGVIAAHPPSDPDLTASYHQTLRLLVAAEAARDAG